MVNLDERRVHAERHQRGRDVGNARFLPSLPCERFQSGTRGGEGEHLVVHVFHRARAVLRAAMGVALSARVLCNRRV